MIKINIRIYYLNNKDKYIINHNYSFVYFYFELVLAFDLLLITISLKPYTFCGLSLLSFFKLAFKN
jgi:hypothetical protein